MRGREAGRLLPTAMTQASSGWGAWSTIHKEGFVIGKNRPCKRTEGRNSDGLFVIRNSYDVGFLSSEKAERTSNVFVFSSRIHVPQNGYI